MALTFSWHIAWLLCFQEKLYQWIRRQQEEGSRVTTVDILNYIQVFLNIHPTWFVYDLLYSHDIVLSMYALWVDIEKCVSNKNSDTV